jgi:hypothetical protein
MRRTPLALLLVTLAATAPRAEDAPQTASTFIQAQADDLRDAVASPKANDSAVRNQAAAAFDNLGTPLMRPKPHFMDREPVDGHPGSVDGMIDTANERYDHYKMTATEVPDAALANAVSYVKDMKAQKRIKFDAAMAENQMGDFTYSLTDKTDKGVVNLNARLTLMATRIGEAFCYATLVHEAAHAKARADGRLDPAHTIDNEVEAYGVQYHWVKVVDPSSERMIVLHSTLKLYLEKHPEDQVTRASISYLEHLLQLVDTDGEDQKLRAFIKGMGYQDADKDHSGGVNSSAAPVLRV